RPPMSIVPASSSTKKPTGLFCTWPPGATVARRPRRWVARNFSSDGVSLMRPSMKPRPWSRSTQAVGQPAQRVVVGDRAQRLLGHARRAQPGQHVREQVRVARPAVLAEVGDPVDAAAEQQAPGVALADEV